MSCDLQAGGTDVHDKEGSGKSSVVTNETIQNQEEKLPLDGHLMTAKLHGNSPQASKTVLYEMVLERLGYWKLCTCWITEILTTTKKIERLLQAYLAHYTDQGHKFLD